MSSGNIILKLWKIQLHLQSKLAIAVKKYLFEKLLIARADPNVLVNKLNKRDELLSKFQNRNKYKLTSLGSVTIVLYILIVFQYLFSSFTTNSVCKSVERLNQFLKSVGKGQTQKRQIIWFNPPYSNNVKTSDFKF